MSVERQCVNRIIPPLLNRRQDMAANPQTALLLKTGRTPEYKLLTQDLFLSYDPWSLIT
jgi:hypothetical protein